MLVMKGFMNVVWTWINVVYLVL